MPKPSKPVSQAKLAANRANAKQSTGPRTPEGKARSAMNALKHGLLAESTLIPGDPGESPEELRAIHDALLDQFGPAGPFEQILIDRFVSTYWRLRRACRHEIQSILDRREQCQSPIMVYARSMAGKATPYPPDQVATEGRFQLLTRYETMLDRTLHRLTQQLIRLRTARSSPSAGPSPRPCATDDDDAPAPNEPTRPARDTGPTERPTARATAQQADEPPPTARATNESTQERIDGTTDQRNEPTKPPSPSPNSSLIIPDSSSSSATLLSETNRPYPDPAEFRNSNPEKDLQHEPAAIEHAPSAASMWMRKRIYAPRC